MTNGVTTNNVMIIVNGSNDQYSMTNDISDDENDQWKVLMKWRNNENDDNETMVII